MPFDSVRHDFEPVSVAKSFAAPFRLVRLAEGPL